MKQAGSGAGASPSNPYDDVRVELAALCFDRLMPTLISSGTAVVLVCAVLTAHYHSRWFLQLTVAVALSWFFRMAIAYRFSRKRTASMTVASAARWEAWYGYATILYVTAAALVTMSTRHQKDSIGVSLTTLGTFAFINGIGARVSVRPVVAKLSALILMLGLAVALLSASELITRCSVVGLLLYAHIYCNAVNIKYEVLVEQLRLRRKMSDLAAHDVLTGLPNRREFSARLAAGCGGKTSFALLYLDLDGFKKVNDTLGHATGDALLQQVAVRLQEAVPAATVARLGGDEFALLCPSAEKPWVEEAATRINQAIAAPFSIDQLSVTIGTSIGIELAFPPRTDPDMLLSKADEALYEVKRAGGGSFRFAERSEPHSVFAHLAVLPPTPQALVPGQDSDYRLGKLLAGMGEQQAHLPHLGVG